MKISNPNKILYPKQKETKKDVINYYNKISEYILPFLKDRPINMERFVDGIRKQGFYQKKAPEYFPKYIKRVKIKLKNGKEQEQIMVNNKKSLIYLANQDCIVFHSWLSQSDNLNKPDKLIYDLDPPHNNHKEFKKVIFAAFKIKEKLEKNGLPSFPMLTGSFGLHILIPLKKNNTYEEVRRFAKQTARELVKEHPDKLTLEMMKDKRGNKIFLDYLRNAYGQTTVTPYSLRAKPEMSVATPIDWDELKNKNINSRTYTAKNIFRRLSRKKGLWENYNNKRYNLPK